MPPERKKWQKPAKVIALMEIEPGMIVADIGAGTGYFLDPLSAAVGPRGKVLGLDVEPAMVAFMTERIEREGWSNVEARTIPPNDPGLVGGMVHRILVVNTWHHIDDRERYSRKLHDVLIPGGRVLVVDFTHQSSHGPPVSRRLRSDEVVAELQAGGLEVEVLKESLPDQYVVVGRPPARLEGVESLKKLTGNWHLLVHASVSTQTWWLLLRCHRPHEEIPRYWKRETCGHRMYAVHHQEKPLT